MEDMTINTSVEETVVEETTNEETKTYTSLTFDIQLNATTVAAKNFGSYFTIPITLNLDAY